jgi:hypothetical protein
MLPIRPYLVLHRSRTLPFVLAATVSCSANGNDSAASDSAVAMSEAREQSAASPMVERGMVATRMADASAPPAPPSPLPQPPGQGGGTITMIIRTGSASIEVDSLEPAIAAVQRMATALGGVVGNTSLSAGDYEVRSATIELRIPSQRFNEALEGLRPIGKVESVQSNAQDVSEEFVDITARIANAKRLEERLIALLANRTGKLEEVLTVERELARVREEIERYEGRVRYLSTRAATSTLTITVHEARPLVTDTPGPNVIGEAFKQAWRNFVTLVAAAIAALGILIPLGLLAAPLIIALIRYQRRRAANEAAAAGVAAANAAAAQRARADD